MDYLMECIIYINVIKDIEGKLYAKYKTKSKSNIKSKVMKNMDKTAQYSFQKWNLFICFDISASLRTHNSTLNTAFY